MKFVKGTVGHNELDINDPEDKQDIKTLLVCGTYRPDPEFILYDAQDNGKAVLIEQGDTVHADIIVEGLPCCDLYLLLVDAAGKYYYFGVQPQPWSRELYLQDFGINQNDFDHCRHMLSPDMQSICSVVDRIEDEIKTLSATHGVPVYAIIGQ